MIRITFIQSEAKIATATNQGHEIITGQSLLCQKGFIYHTSYPAITIEPQFRLIMRP